MNADREKHPRSGVLRYVTDVIGVYPTIRSKATTAPTRFASFALMDLGLIIVEYMSWALYPGALFLSISCEIM